MDVPGRGPSDGCVSEIDHASAKKAAAPIHKQKIITAAGYYQKGEKS